jgi:pimeloyl-ACP methyl ester carboxylesterase
MSSPLTHKYISTNGIRLHVVEAGKPGGELIVFLHGFPEFWYAWRYQIDYFARAGFHVLVPDQRGYNLSEKPNGTKAYNLDELAKDIVGMIDAYQREKAFIVGHDWGGVAAWRTAMVFPDRVQKLAVLNAPHPKVMRQHLKTNPAQRRRSRYVFLFQLPWLPEWRMRKENWDYCVRALQRTSRPGTFSDEDIALYRAAWSQPGAATAMLNWYRAGFRSRPKRRLGQHVTVPTLLIWGAKDRFLGREMAQESIDLCDNGRLEYIEEATHWVQHEEAGRVNGLLHDFF